MSERIATFFNRLRCAMKGHGGIVPEDSIMIEYGMGKLVRCKRCGRFVL